MCGGSEVNQRHWAQLWRLCVLPQSMNGRSTDEPASRCSCSSVDRSLNASLFICIQAAICCLWCNQHSVMTLWSYVFYGRRWTSAAALYGTQPSLHYAARSLLLYFYIVEPNKDVLSSPWRVDFLTVPNSWQVQEVMWASSTSVTQEMIRRSRGRRVARAEGCHHYPSFQSPWSSYRRQQHPFKGRASSSDTWISRNVSRAVYSVRLCLYWETMRVRLDASV